MPIVLRAIAADDDAPTTPNIANAMMYGTCSALDSSFAITMTIPTVAIAMNATTNDGHRAGRGRTDWTAARPQPTTTRNTSTGSSRPFT